MPVRNPTRLRRLEHRRQELLRRYELLVERVALFPNAANQRQLNDLTCEMATLDRHLHELGAETTATA